MESCIITPNRFLTLLTLTDGGGGRGGGDGGSESERKYNNQAFKLVIYQSNLANFTQRSASLGNKYKPFSSV